MATPLEGIRILDWTQWQMGTVATSMLADLGAEVIHIEDKNLGDAGRGLSRVRGASIELANGRNAYFEYNNHNKKGIAVDLKKPEGKEMIYRLVKNSDVFVHNFRQGVPERLGLGYETLCQHNAKLIYAALSGYGPNGPEAKEPAFDYLGLARSGIMTAVGEPDSPPSSFYGGMADQMGAIMAAYGVLAALMARERHDVGQKIDISHLGSMMMLQGLGLAFMNFSGIKETRSERKKVANPLWNHYLCKDQKWLVLGMLQPDRQWPAVCQALNIEHLEKDPKFENQDVRRDNCEELIAIMDQVFITKTSKDWMKLLKEAGDVICTPVQEIPDLLEDPQTWANDYFIKYDHKDLGEITGMGLPVQFSQTPGEVRLEAPHFGEHTEMVLLEVGGYTWEEIAALKEKEVI